jgi:4-hydroxy-2-oxoglutarate aldolase
MATYSMTEFALNKLHGYGVAPRKPLLPLKESEGEAFMDILREMIDLEAEYTKN